MRMHTVNYIKTGDKPRAIFSIAIIGANDELEHGMGIPINEVDGDYEELRKQLHRDIDNVLDAAQNKGEFMNFIEE